MDKRSVIVNKIMVLWFYNVFFPNQKGLVFRIHLFISCTWFLKTIIIWKKRKGTSEKLDKSITVRKHSKVSQKLIRNVPFKIGGNVIVCQIWRKPVAQTCFYRCNRSMDIFSRTQRFSVFFKSNNKYYRVKHVLCIVFIPFEITTHCCNNCCSRRKACLLFNVDIAKEYYRVIFITLERKPSFIR